VPSTTASLATLKVEDFKMVTRTISGAPARAYSPLAPSTLHANRLVARKLAERLHSVFLHNDHETFIDYAAHEIEARLNIVARTREGQP
jgi:hypothetical protein